MMAGQLDGDTSDSGSFAKVVLQLCCSAQR